MAKIEVTIHSPRGAYSGTMNTAPNMTGAEMSELVQSLQQEFDQIESLTIRDKEQREATFHQKLLRDSVVYFKVVY
jgi:hypothetical protein